MCLYLFTKAVVRGSGSIVPITAAGRRLLWLYLTCFVTCMMCVSLLRHSRPQRVRHALHCKCTLFIVSLNIVAVTRCLAKCGLSMDKSAVLAETLKHPVCFAFTSNDGQQMCQDKQRRQLWNCGRERCFSSSVFFQIIHERRGGEGRVVEA
jgi:hypothetical protein